MKGGVGWERDRVEPHWCLESREVTAAGAPLGRGPGKLRSDWGSIMRGSTPVTPNCSDAMVAMV
jgi:hypothetical protein